jgi:hypothetical protein
MPLPIQLPDTVYDNTHTWQNANDRVSFQRSFSLDPGEAAKSVAALTYADPAVPNEYIRETLTAPITAERDMVVDRTPPGAMEMFGPAPGGHANDFGPTNFSGKQSPFSGTGTPAMPAW